MTFSSHYTIMQYFVLVHYIKPNKIQGILWREKTAKALTGADTSPRLYVGICVCAVHPPGFDSLHPINSIHFKLLLNFSYKVLLRSLKRG